MAADSFGDYQGAPYADMGNSSSGTAGSPMSLATGAVGGAMAGASFGPVGMAVGAAVGIGLQLFGGMAQHDAAQAYNQAQTAQIKSEEAIESEKMQHTEIMASRMKMENVRKVQMAQAMGLQAATNQGAGSGSNSSGLAGGQAQARSQGSWNELGINQSLYTARNIYGLTQQINDQRIAMANAGMNMQTGGAISSLGSGIMSNLPAIGRLSSGFGNQQPSGGGGWMGNTLGFGNNIS